MNGTIEKIKKRSGLIVDFDRTKIERAIAKACLATHTSVAEYVVQHITDAVIEDVKKSFPEAVPEVEDIQDIVEKRVADHGLFQVAKAYILYRQEHAQQREKQRSEIAERARAQELTVSKRDGRTVRFDVNEITEAIVNCCGEVKGDIDVDAAVREATANLYDGISTREIDQAVVMALKGRIEGNPAYSTVAARYLFGALYKDVLGLTELDEEFEDAYRYRFAQSVRRGVDAGRLEPRMLEFDFDTLAQELKPKRDHAFEYLGAQTLYDRYFLRDMEQNVLEVPQYFWMRVAMGLSFREANKEARAAEFYHTMSTMRYVPSTPTLFHSGTAHPQMSSCYLTTVEDDLHHIFKSVGDNAQLSKWSGGLGNDWTNVRATGARIKSMNIGSQGVVPFLKISDATTAAINRSGKRRGAACVYLETWHYDIEDFLELRKNTGDERRRTHDTNIANWIPDLFMKRVIADGEWTLFSPDETPELHHLYGKAFERKYVEYEEKAARGEMALVKKMRAKDLWRKMITMLFETGHPWMTFKDPCNIRSPQDHVGTVHSSNLCTEITLNTSAEETAVCNIGSINLARHLVNGRIDNNQLQQTVRTAIRMLDNVIDLNFYPTKEAASSNLRHRPVGLGVMGLQDALYEDGMRFDSEEAVEFGDRIMEFIAYHAIGSSSELAKERGPYPSYRGSKWERGLMPLDTLALLEQERGLETGVSKTARLDWDALKARVKAHGMRNSNCLAIAPTATISTIAGCFPSIEPIYKNIYVKSNQGGEFTKNNQYLINDLKARKLWNQEVLEQLKHYDGSVQKIAEIPDELKEKYREVFEMDPAWIVRHAAYRGKWIDQSQSVNIFVSTNSGAALSDLYMMAWRMGLKTTYYLRTLGASAVEKSTLDVNKKFEVPTVTTVATVATVEVQKTPARTVYVAADAICEACQ